MNAEIAACRGKSIATNIFPKWPLQSIGLLAGNIVDTCNIGIIGHNDLLYYSCRCERWDAYGSQRSTRGPIPL